METVVALPMIKKLEMRCEFRHIRPLPFKNFPVDFPCALMSQSPENRGPGRINVMGLAVEIPISKAHRPQIGSRETSTNASFRNLHPNLYFGITNTSKRLALASGSP